MKLFLRLLLIFIVIFISILFYYRHITRKMTIISAGKPVPVYQVPRAAMLVVDIQEGTTGESSAIQGYKKVADTVIHKINNLAELAEAREIPVIFVFHQTTNRFFNLVNNTFARGSLGAQPDKRLNPGSHKILTKNTLDAFGNPNLDEFLLRNHTEKIYITGLDAAYCINHTIQAAINRNYQVIVIEDVLISGNDSIKNIMLEDFKAKGVQIISSGEFPE
ncbi:MAG: cysteine hydrolase [Bacteroidales bacterium]|nr:cysteine hydrolase [Bacteroidales bacterium]